MVVAIADGAEWKAAGLPGGNKTTICHHIRTSYGGAALELVLAARRAKCSRFLPCDGFRYNSVVQVAMGEREWLVDSEESFMACYQATVDDTFRYAGILCGKDRAAAEDATQEAYFSLLRRVHADQVSAVTVFTRATTGGLELAVLGSPPPDLSEDLLATWPTPPAPDVSLSDAPMMLPSIAMPDGATRIQGVGEFSGLVDYNQYWIDGATGIVLSIQTDILQRPGVDGTFVTVAPWDNAFFSRMSGGYEQLILVDPAGSVALWTNGLDRSQLVDIARSLRPRATSGGWESDGLPAGMVAVNEGWTVGGADRTVLWANAELSISSGGPSAIVTPLQFGSTARLTDVNGAPAMFFDHGDWSALGWSPEPGITVVFALYGTPAEVEAAARTIGRVDVAAWEGESTDVTGQDDGCQSSFFC